MGKRKTAVRTPRASATSARQGRERRFAFLATVVIYGMSLTSCGKDVRETPEYKTGYDAGHQRGLVEGNEYRRGFEDGQRAGVDAARPGILSEGIKAGFADGCHAARPAAIEEGFRAGYTEGFEAARPGTGGRRRGAWFYFTTAAAVIGMLKILVALGWFTTAMILKSRSPLERIAKVLVTCLSFLVLLWLTHSLTIGFSTSLDEVFLNAGAATTIGKVGWGALGVAGMYAFLFTLDSLLRSAEGHRYLQAICVFVSSFALGVLGPFFVSLHRVPDLHRYLFCDVVLGVVIGGLLFVVRTVFRMADGDGAWPLRVSARVPRPRPVPPV